MPVTRIGDVDLHWESAGSGAVQLLIHGLGSSGRDWERQVPFFATDRRVVTVDLRGHGRSGKPRGPYRIEQFAGDLASFAKSRELGPVDLVGISLGGIVCLEAVLSFPGLARSLVLINTTAESVLRGMKRRLMYWQRLLLTWILGMRGVARVLSKKLFPAPEQEELRHAFIKRWIENDKRAYLSSLRSVAGWSAIDRLDRLSIPVLVLVSEHDYIPEEEHRAWVAKIPDARFRVIAGARHAVTIERPDEVNRAIAEFMTEVEAKAGTP